MRAGEKEMSNMADVQMEKRRKAINQALASVCLEGLEPSNDYLETVDRYIKGEITSSDLVALVVRKAQAKGKGEEND